MPKTESSTIPPTLSKFPLLQFTKQIRELLLAVDPDKATAEEVVEALQLVELLKRQARDLDRLAKAQAIEWIETQGQDLQVEGLDIRYYIARAKREYTKDHAATLEDLFTRAGGEIEKVAECLSSKAWKPGTVEGLFGKEARRRHFIRESQKDLKTGKPKRELRRVDPRFTRRSA